MLFLSQLARWQQRLIGSTGRHVPTPVRSVSVSASSTHYSPIRLVRRSLFSPWGTIGTSSGPGSFVANNRGYQYNLNSCDQHPSQTMLQLQTLGNGMRCLSNNSYRNKPNSRRGNEDSLIMKDFQTIEIAANASFNNLDRLTPRHLSSFWTRVSQLVTPRYQNKRKIQEQQQQQLASQLKSIFLSTMGKIKTFQPRDLTATALGFAKISKVVDDRNRRQSRFQGTHQQTTLRYVLIGQNEQQQKIIFELIAKASMPKLQKFEPRYLSNLAYANAIVGCVPMVGDGSTLFDHIAEKSIPLLRKFNAQDLANMVWAYEKVGVSSPRLFEEVAKSIVAINHLGKFKPQALSNIVLTFAKSGESTSGLFQKVASHIVDRDDLEGFKPQALSNILLAFEQAEVSHPLLLKKVADHIAALDNLSSFNAQVLSDTVWAFAKAKESQRRLFYKVADHILALDNLHSFNSKSCSQLLWSFATAEIIHRPLFDKVAAHVNAHIDADSLEKNVK